MYRGKDDWKYINISVMETLWKEYGDMKENSEWVIQRLENSDYKHRFDKDMYNALCKYLECGLNGKLLRTVFDEKLIDTFYLTIIKICVLKQRYIGYTCEPCEEALVYIMNELKNHSELMSNRNLKETIYGMSYSYFMNLDSVPNGLNISLETLLLTNIKPEVIYHYEASEFSWHYESIGAYLLIKLREMPVNMLTDKKLKHIISTSFQEKNMSVEEFEHYLSEKSSIWSFELNYIQKEYMMDFLRHTLVEIIELQDT